MKRAIIISLLLISMFAFITNNKYGAATITKEYVPTKDGSSSVASLGTGIIGTETVRYSGASPNVVISLKESKYRVLGEYEKFVFYDGGLVYRAPKTPPVPYIRLNLSGNIENVELVYVKYRTLTLGRIAFIPSPIPFMVNTDYDEMLNQEANVTSKPSFWPSQTILGVERQREKSTVLLALAQYDCRKNTVRIALEIGLKVSYSRRARIATSNTYDAILIVPRQYLSYAENYTLLHTGKSILIVTTDWIYANYEESEPPPYPGFEDRMYPGFSSLSRYYNYSLALRIIAFLRDMIGVAKTVILFGNALDIPPSYYYWDANFYRIYPNYKQAWVPTDIFYASPDYDFIPEFAIGRIPFLSNKDIETYLTKISLWLNASRTNATWLSKVNVVGGMPFGTLYYSGEATIMKIINDGYFGNLSISKYFETNWKYNSTMVKQLFRTPSLFLLEFSHGAETALYKLNKYAFRWVKLIDVSYLLNLDWADGFPIVVAPACSSGTYDYGIFSGSLKMSFGEAVLFSKAGGIAYIGMSRIAYGALTFYFEKGILKIPLLAYAQAFLEYIFRAYADGARLLGELYSKAVEYYAQENDMAYWINRRTIFQSVLLGDPLLELPHISKNNNSLSVSVDNEARTIILPLTFGEAYYYDENPIVFNVDSNDNVTVTMFSPQEPLSYRVPFFQLNVVPRTFRITLPSSGLYVIRVEGAGGKEERIYCRGIGARLNDAKIILGDSNGNGKVDFVKIRLNVSFSYASVSSLVWGFRTWIKIGFVGENVLRVNRNQMYKSKCVGNQILEFWFDGSLFLSGSGIMRIELFFFSWWPYLMTWWMSGPSIWMEFGFHGYVDVRNVVFEPAISVDYKVLGLVDTDGDGKFEGVDLEFTITMNINASSKVSMYLYFNRIEKSPRGSVSYIYSMHYPVVFVGGQNRIRFRYVWCMDAWYARGAWGSLDPNNVARRYYYSFRIYIINNNGKNLFSSSRWILINEITNESFDKAEKKEVILDSIEVVKINDTTGRSVGVVISFVGHATSAGFQRTEFILEKNVNGTWQTIYSKELTAGIFIFFWPVLRKRFVIGFFPTEFLGNGTFRVTIQVFKYVGGRKTILAKIQDTFEFQGVPLVANRSVDLLDKDLDGLVGHISLGISLRIAMEKVKVAVSVQTSATKTYYVTRWFENSIDEQLPLSIASLRFVGNTSITIKLFLGAEEFLMQTSTIVSSISINKIFEDGVLDDAKGYKPMIIATIPKVVNSSKTKVSLWSFARYVGNHTLKVRFDGEKVASVMASESSRISIVVNASQGVHNLSVEILWGNKRISYDFEMIVDLEPPNLSVRVRSPAKSLELAWSVDDLSGVDKIAIYANSTEIDESKDAVGSITKVLDEGVYNITILAIDNAGWSSVKQFMVRIDQTPPTIVTEIGTSSGRIALNITIIDGSGIEKSWIILDNGTVVDIKPNTTLMISEDIGDLYVHAVDGAGNIAVVKVKIEQRIATRICVDDGTRKPAIMLSLISIIAVVAPIVSLSIIDIILTKKEFSTRLLKTHKYHVSSLLAI